MPKWKLKDPTIFPSKYFEVVRRACQIFGKEIHLSTHRTLYEAKSEADKFRAWRRCIREYGTTDIFTIERDYTIRADIKTQGDYPIFITVKPKLITSMIELNPWIAGLISDA